MGRGAGVGAGLHLRGARQRLHALEVLQRQREHGAARDARWRACVKQGERRRGGAVEDAQRVHVVRTPRGQR